MLSCIGYLVTIYSSMFITCIYNLYLSYIPKNNTNQYINMSQEKIIDVIVT